MMRTQRRRRWPRLVACLPWLLALGLVACRATAPVAHTSQPEQAGVETVTLWPDSLRVVGDGYPNPGDPCRRIGETAATSRFLDDAADLVGCVAPVDAPEVRALVDGHGARLLQVVDGVVLLSVPRR